MCSKLSKLEQKVLWDYCIVFPGVKYLFFSNKPNFHAFYIFCENNIICFLLVLEFKKKEIEPHEKYPLYSIHNYTMLYYGQSSHIMCTFYLHAIVRYEGR